MEEMRKPTGPGFYWVQPVGTEDYPETIQIVYVGRHPGPGPFSSHDLYVQEIGEESKFSLSRYSRWIGPLERPSATT